MNTKHLPGPWRIDYTTEGAFTIENRIGSVICQRGPWNHRAAESIANGRLIASAPDLLAALKGIAECVEGGSEDIDDWCEQARAAIAKAEGSISEDARSSTERGEAHTERQERT